MKMVKPLPKGEKPVHDQTYLDFIDRQPCLVPGCRRKATHHHQAAKGHKGMGQKADDQRCLPLCCYHHTGDGIGVLPGSVHHSKLSGEKFFTYYRIDPEREIERLKELWSKRT